jgi:hypothetical protein
MCLKCPTVSHTRREEERGNTDVETKWKLIEHWQSDLPSLSVQQLRERLAVATEYERRSMRKGSSPNAAREWQARRRQVEEELVSRS